MRHFKPGVEVVWTEATLTIQDAVEHVYGSWGYNWVITAGRDGKHMKGSKHYTNEALDIRTFHLKDEDRAGVLADLRERLGRDYDVLDEGSHIHAEFDPK